MAEPTNPGHVNPAIDAQREVLLRTLVDHGVQFVVIGGAGIQSHGRRYDTLDIDLTPDRDEANLQRLADALNKLDCRLVTDPANPAAWVPLPPDYFTPRTLLAATVWNLATRHGQLDLTFASSGFPGGYGELAPRAEHLTVAGTRIAVLVPSEESRTGRRVLAPPGAALLDYAYTGHADAVTTLRCDRHGHSPRARDPDPGQVLDRRKPLRRRAPRFLFPSTNRRPSGRGSATRRGGLAMARGTFIP
jgi:hypothetical protein